MNPITHLLMGWTVATLPGGLSRADRAWVVAAGLLPDLDGLGIVAEVATRNSDRPLLWWSEYHHVLGHNLGAGILVASAALAFTRRWTVAILAGVSFHLHLLGDLVGGRGPDGAQWPIPYLLPFSSSPRMTVSWQWALNAWPNVALTIVLMAYAFWYAWARGRSPLELVSIRVDEAFVRALRQRFRRQA